MSSLLQNPPRPPPRNHLLSQQSCRQVNPKMPIPFINAINRGKKKDGTGASSAQTAATAKTAAEKLGAGMVTVQDIIAPESIDVDFTHLKIGNTLFRTLFIVGYPRFVSANWLAP